MVVRVRDVDESRDVGRLFVGHNGCVEDVLIEVEEQVWDRKNVHFLMLALG